MAKIAFDIKYRPQIESGEYRVETKAGCPVRIVCWDMACELPILGLVLLNDEKAEEMAVGFTNEGTNLLGEPLYDKLFIVTPEEELTDWEKAVGIALTDYQLLPRDKDGIANIHDINEFTKKKAAELLSFAKKELDEEIPELEFEPIEETLEYKVGYRAGKAEVLNNLPKWEKYPHNAGSEPLINGILQKDGSYKWRLYLDGYKIEISDLEKLPGFKKN